MTSFVLVLRALEYVLLVVQLWFNERFREEGRQEVHTKQEQANEAAAEVATQIDADVRNADLDDLRDRMRPYQRPSDAL